MFATPDYLTLGGGTAAMMSAAFVASPGYSWGRSLVGAVVGAAYAGVFWPEGGLVLVVGLAVLFGILGAFSGGRVVPSLTLAVAFVVMLFWWGWAQNDPHAIGDLSLTAAYGGAALFTAAFVLAIRRLWQDWSPETRAQVTLTLQGAFVFFLLAETLRGRVPSHLAASQSAYLALIGALFGVIGITSYFYEGDHLSPEESVILAQTFLRSASDPEQGSTPQDGPSPTEEAGFGVRPGCGGHPIGERDGPAELPAVGQAPGFAQGITCRFWQSRCPPAEPARRTTVDAARV